ncbi:FecR family protein [Fodinibius halophilus]|uniref:DUF4974 domain-containing protein n=1 Tax=Fodinibius halophilus TaxID=1736908 RepID=A0A6M1TB50_9BACT|nr:FecR domain-containing protein [Fodinibius halophilus]NGP89251.1 DUF4974 domain-containing protein [Fodinibius halophilus]
MNWQILRKYIRGQCSEQELRQLGEWLQEQPANEDFFEFFIEHWQSNEEVDFEVDAQEAWKHFKRKQDIASSSDTREFPAAIQSKRSYAVHGNRSKQRKGYWYSLAAAAIILIAGLYGVSQYVVDLQSSDVNKMEAQEITTSKAQRIKLKLSDGTLVTLNAESVLKIPEDYGISSRTLHLQGEAFFDVKHEEHRPFVVHTPKGYVKDLGTQFNVMAYDSSRIEVAVKEGLASIGEIKKDKTLNDLVELTPNKLGVLEKEGGLTVSDIKDMKLFTGWAEGQLVFRKTPFPEVVERLERWFDIESVIKDSSLRKRTLTATYDNMPLNEVLQVVAISIHASYERHNGTVTFRDENINTN